MRRLSICLALLLAACGGSSPAAPGPPTPAPATVSLASVAVSPAGVAGGAAAVGTITLSAAAPSNGTTVTLASSHAAVRVSPVVVVPAGMASATFAVATETVASDTDATITASLDGVTRTANLRITGVPAGSGPLVGLSTAIDDVVSGESTTGTISAAAPASSGGIRVDLASSDTDVTVPASVVIAAGTTSASFEIRTSMVFVEKDVRLTATVASSLQQGASQIVAVVKLRVPRPRVDSVSPASAVPGTSVNVTLTGAMFIPGATVSASGSGVSVSGVVIDSLSSIRATLTISSSAASGERQISVSTAGGSASAAFGVGTAVPPARPTITSVSPRELRAYTFGGFTVTGTNFTPDAVVSISGTGVTLDRIGHSTASLLVLGYSATENAPLGARTVTVTTAGGTSEAYTIEVLPPIPHVSRLSPSSAVTGTSVDVAIIGDHFLSPVTVAPRYCTTITVSNVTFVSPTQINARFTIPADAPILPCFIDVNSAGWTAGSHLEIVPPPPTITNISGNPYTGTGPINMIITGTNFRGYVTVQVTGGGVTVGYPNVANHSGILVLMTLDPNFTSGNRSITVTTPGGTSNAVTWTINRPSVSGGQ